jgi:SHS2 domain-containing protein
MSPHGYHELDHPADLALRVWGEDFFVLLRQSALGMYHLMGIKAEENYIQERQSFLISKETPETILVDFLNELLYLVEDLGLVLGKFSFTEEDESIIIEASGRKIESIERSIKAVTFNDLDIREIKSRVETIITFDV